MPAPRPAPHPFSLQRTDEPLCPFCGAENPSASEVFLFAGSPDPADEPDEPDEADATCEECGEVFVVEQIVICRFNTRRPGEDADEAPVESEP